jgi:hypothetical protein
MGDVYRKDPVGDPLGESARESDAITVFGVWRDRVRTLVVLGFAVVGIVPAALTWYLVQDYQFAHNAGRALLVVNVGTSAIVWGAMFALGAFVGRRIVRARAPEKLAWLAKTYDVPISKLEDTATMVNKL